MPGHDAVAALADFLRADAHCLMKGGHKEIYIARAPGRLDVLGGATEHFGGLACQWPLEAGAAVAVQRRDDRKLMLARYHAGQPAGAREMVALSLDDFYGSAALMPAPALRQMFAGEKHWAAHAAGAFPALAQHKKITRKTPGANIALCSDIPESGGEDALGAAAAIACATLFGLAAAHHLILEPLEIALLAHRLEGQTAGAPGGYAAPLTAVFGKKDCLLLMTGQPHELTGASPPPRGLVFAGLHAAVPGNAGESHNAARRLHASAGIAQAMVSRTYRDFGLRKDPTGGYLANLPRAMLQRYFEYLLPVEIRGEKVIGDFSEGIPKALHLRADEIYFPRAAAQWMIGESGRARRFAETLKGADTLAPAEARKRAMAAGAILRESHAAQQNLLRDIGDEPAAAELEIWRELIAESGGADAQGFLGLRAAGDFGGGGTVAVLLEDGDAGRGKLRAVGDGFQARTGAAVDILWGSSNGAAETEAMRLDVGELRKD